MSPVRSRELWPGLRAAVALAVLYAALACVPKAGPPVDMAPADAPASGRVGAPCARGSDCQTGLCYVDNFFNRADRVTAPGGYCSLVCARDADCTPYGGICVQLSDGGVCLARCSAEGDCRSGYACWTFEPDVCFSADRLDCDPTAANGACIVGGQAGGCIRKALGAGLKGECLESCTVVPDNCTATAAGARSCIVLDRTRASNGAPSGDGFKGAVCSTVVMSPPAIGDGKECLYPSTDGTPAHFSDVCVSGDECYLQGTPGQGFSVDGDNLCHRLCNPGSCSAPLTCRDVFGLFNSGNPVGLCLQP